MTFARQETECLRVHLHLYDVHSYSLLSTNNILMNSEDEIELPSQTRGEKETRRLASKIWNETQAPPSHLPTTWDPLIRSKSDGLFLPPAPTNPECLSWVFWKCHPRRRNSASYGGSEINFAANPLSICIIPARRGRALHVYIIHGDIVHPPDPSSF